MDTIKDQQQQVEEKPFELFNNDTPLGSATAFFELGNDDESIFTPEPPTPGQQPGSTSSLNNKTVDDNAEEADKGTAGSQSPGGEQASSNTATEAKSNTYAEILQSLYGENLTVEVEAEDGSTQEVPISEVDLDEDGFRELLQQQQESFKKETSKEYIPKKGLSEFMMNLIDIDRNGGDVRQLLEIKTQHMDSIENYDLSTIDGQRKMIAHERSLRGDDHDDIRMLLEQYEKAGVLQQKAEKVKEDLQGRFSKVIEDQKKKTEADKTLREEHTKKYKKSLREEVDLYELSKQDKEKIVKISTETVQGADGKPRYGLDQLYASFREDPKLNAKLALFLSNPDTYDKIVSSKKVEEVTLSRFKLKKRKPGSGSAEFSAATEESTPLLFE